MAADISITQEIIRGAVTVISVFLGARMALKTYRSNQRWDASHLAYEKAIEILDRLQTTSFEYWLRSIDAYGKNGTLFNAVVFEDLNKAKSDFDVAMKDFDNLIKRGRFNMSETTRSILFRAYIKLSQYPFPAPAIKMSNEWPDSILEDVMNQFCYAAQVDLQILSWRERLLTLVERSWRRLSPIVHSVISWALVCGLVIWFGREKGRRIAAKYEEVGDLLF